MLGSHLRWYNASNDGAARASLVGERASLAGGTITVIAREILDYYALGYEEQRLTQSLGRLESIRTWEILDRHLAPPPARIRILDVGGGTGVYALPLSERGHEVHLVDAVPLHVERARALSKLSASPLASIEIGDARGLTLGDRSVDAVLLLGPLYHLIDRQDRLRAIAEAKRVLVPGGLLFTSYISRFASTCDGLQEGALRDDTFAKIVHGDLDHGVHQNASRRSGWFTTSYFHRPEEIAPELEESGMELKTLIAVEGPGWIADDVDAWLDDADARERLLHVLRRIEVEPSLLGVSPHLLALSKA